MRRTLLASSLLFYSVSGFAEPNCAIPPSPLQPAAQQSIASGSDSAADVAATLISPERIARVPALKRISSNGASLYDLGIQHGLPTVFARSGGTFQVFYLTPDGQAAVGGVMWDYTGHNITRDQVSPIEGAVPTITIASGASPATKAGVPPVMEQAPSPSILATVKSTVFGTTGSSAAPRLYMFIDPLCSFSVRAMDQLRPFIAAGKLQVAVIPLSVLDYEDQGRSTIAAKSLVGMPAEQMVEAWRNQMTAPLPPVGPEASVQLGKNMAAAEALRLRGTPTFVWEKTDGSVGRADGIQRIASSQGSLLRGCE
jgi:thiol:disulfide interchange protein DsbG